MHACETMQLLVLAEDFFDHHIERLTGVAMRLADQPPQSLEILRGIAQAVDVIEPQPLQPVFRDQALHQPVNGVERAGVLDPQSGQRIDVEEAPVVDFAGGEPPLPELVVLTLQQMMQRQRLRGPRPGRRGRRPVRAQ